MLSGSASDCLVVLFSKYKKWRLVNMLLQTYFHDHKLTTTDVCTPCCNMCGENSTRPKFSAPPSPSSWLLFTLAHTMHQFFVYKIWKYEMQKISSNDFAKNPKSWNSTPGTCLLGWHLQLALCVCSPHCCTTACCAMFAYAWAPICMSRLEMCIAASLLCEDLICESSKNKTNTQTTLRMLFQAIWWGIQEDCAEMMIVSYFILQGFFPQHPITTPPT
jgi:hypothetical protein